MRDGFDEGIGFGLSEEEKNDLEELMRAARRPPGEGLRRRSPDELQDRVDQLEDQARMLAGIVLELDERINLLYRIIRLCYQKNELMGGRPRWPDPAGHPDRRY